MSSSSAKHIADGLGIKRVRQQGKYRWKLGHKVINWGNSRVPNWMTPVAISSVFNKPANVEVSSDKTQCFQKLKASNIPIPEFVTSITEAKTIMLNGPKYVGLKHGVVCRTLTRANSGRGIVFATTSEEIVPAPLYTRYVPKQAEYRVHVFKELGVIDVQQKRKDSEVPETARDPYIRNHGAGWVFCRENIQCPQVVLNAAVDAVMALGLDFGAVDIGFYNTIGACVYEVNTAPGLEGQTLVKYAEAFKKIYV